MEVVNLFGDEWDGGRDRPGWQWKWLPVGKRLGASRMGASLYEVAPGQRAGQHSRPRLQMHAAASDASWGVNGRD